MRREIDSFNEPWDVLIIGGGATGLGAAVDAAARGYKTLLLEQHDFAKGTSSRSTKLIHGGVRYLQKGNIALVLEALRERGHLCRNAPHLIYHRSFFVPSYHWWEGPFYGVGLKIYDMLAGALGIEPSRALSREETLQVLPTLEPKGLRGGVIYYDGQFDDARLAITLAQTAVDLGGVVLNYMRVISLIKEKNVLVGVTVQDMQTSKIIEIKSKAIINATGVFSDSIRLLDDPQVKNVIQPSQGIHLVLDQSFLHSETAILVPHTPDGRVLFMVPWHNRIIIGTTDTPVSSPTLEPIAAESEIDFLLEHAGKYLTKQPKRKDILSVFAGLRPLVAHEGKKTASLSREHTIIVSESGLITIAGGKWTTYRKMGEDVIDKAILVGGLKEHPCKTKTLKLHGWRENMDPLDPWSTYGSDVEKLREILRENPEYEEILDPTLPYLKGEVIWAVRYEMAMTVEDVLSRRTRILLLDANLSIKLASVVAKLMARELNKDEAWEKQQVMQFTELAKNYIPN